MTAYIIRGMEKYIALPQGEAAGVSPEMILKAFSGEFAGSYAGTVVTGDYNLFKKTSDDLKISFPFDLCVSSDEELALAQKKGEKLIFYNLNCINPESYEYGVLSAETGTACYMTTAKAVELIQNNYAQVLATPPMDARSLKLAGFGPVRYENLVGIFAATGKGMNMFDSDGIRIFTHTQYMPLSKAVEEVTYEKVLDTIIRVDSLTLDRSVFASDLPLAIASLNPHHADDDEWDARDRFEVQPAVEAARRIGINVEGPVSADHLMHRASEGRYRAVIALYHDQASVAAMSFDFDRTVVVTWEWPFLRVGSARGAMIEKAGKNIANPVNLVQTLRIASDYLAIGVNS